MATLADESIQFSFHPLIASVYQEVHDWISTIPNAPRYRVKNIYNKMNDLLSDPTFLSAAAQYYVFFPAHFFKVAHTLEYTIGRETLLQWFGRTRHIALVDVGCGAGAASAAFINEILQFADAHLLDQTPSVYCIGVDTNRYATVIYDRFIRLLKDKAKPMKIDLDYKVVPLGALEAVNRIQVLLEEKRQSWGQPYLTDSVVMQVNVVSPFSNRFKSARSEYDELVALGINSEALGQFNDAFGKEEALAYRQILETAHVDRMHIITIGTDGWNSKVEEMAGAIRSEFDLEHHIVTDLGSGHKTVRYFLPEGCYWRQLRNTLQYSSEFDVSVSTVSSKELDDKDWNEIKDINNLRLAWARARHSLLNESLTDEMELRLFESDLDSNLLRLQQQLVAYARDIADSSDSLSYWFPKGPTEARPRGLSKIEEEVLSTAIVQKLGPKITGLASRSYAYRFAKTYGEWGTEYLYDNWFRLYTRFIEDCREEAGKHQSCAIIRTDIKSFYTRIVQDQLVEISHERLSKSSRVEWLLRLLVQRDVDAHEAGRGIVQGNIGSGFYANLYLVDLDARFSAGNEWNAEFFRYVDDMIIIVPNPEHVDEVIDAIGEELDKLHLELNRDARKTEIYWTSEDFLASITLDDDLSMLQQSYEEVCNSLWIMNSDYRQQFREFHFQSSDEWWYGISVYDRCLAKINIFMAPTNLSRKIFGYLFNKRRREGNLKRTSELTLPPFPTDDTEDKARKWSEEFGAQNPDWGNGLSSLRTDLAQMLVQAWDELRQDIVADPARERRLARRLRFASNRLVDIGFVETARIMGDILRNKPWLLRDHVSVLEALARQGFEHEIEAVLAVYTDDPSVTAEYLVAVALRAVRFFPRISEDIWRRVVSGACSGSTVIGLLATETWLHLGAVCEDLVTPEDVSAVRAISQRMPPPTARLQKNYLLILGMYDKEQLSEVTLAGNQLTRHAHKIAQSGEIGSLLAYFEPEIIRHAFYSGSRASASQDDEAGSPF
jgi:hypothetical protein